MNNRYSQTVPQTAAMDQGLRRFMLGTYRYMALAMGVTAVVAYLGGMFLQANPEYMRLLASPWLLLGFVIAIPFLFGSVGNRLPHMSQGSVVAFLVGFSAFMGVFMSAITIFVAPMIIVKIFLMTVAMFGALSLFGYTTQRNLGTFVKYAIAAFIGFVAINVLGMFFPSLQPTGTVDIIINLVALAAIAFITAWETQMLKQVYYGAAGDVAMQDKMAAYGAASLLLSFINMFNILLSLFGNE